jgi:hypothetical protein
LGVVREVKEIKEVRDVREREEEYAPSGSEAEWGGSAEYAPS